MNEPSPENDRRRIEDIEARLKAARAGLEKDQPRGAGAAMSHRQTGVAYRVLVDMIAGLLVGGFFGYWLGRWFGWAPYALIGGLIVGFAAGVNNAWRAIRTYSDEVARGGSGGGDHGESRRLP